jgi:Protein of unknown function (DUF1573)
MMKSKLYFLLALLTVTLATACQQKPAAAADEKAPITNVSNPETDAEPVTPALTTIAFDQTDHNFGEIAKGDKAVHRFTFTNTGTEPLVIENVKPSCSCTVGDYTKEPVAPGQKGFVETSMEAKNVGIFKKNATVTMNTDPKNLILSFSGEVVE